MSRFVKVMAPAVIKKAPKSLRKSAAGSKEAREAPIKAPGSPDVISKMHKGAISLRRERCASMEAPAENRKKTRLMPCARSCGMLAYSVR